MCRVCEAVQSFPTQHICLNKEAKVPVHFFSQKQFRVTSGSNDHNGVFNGNFFVKTVWVEPGDADEIELVVEGEDGTRKELNYKILR